MSKAVTALQKLLGRAPEDFEIAEHIGISLEEYFQMLDDSRCFSLISSEDLPRDYLDSYSASDVIKAVEQ
ncbi:hypothetical protein HGB07_02080, partial [Candidatus Roizmanbacteria bacterium]|nr:hypothetical protein [Candidatus Roizmanbacteria bacterium]